MVFEGTSGRATNRSFSPKFLRRPRSLIYAGPLVLALSFLASGVLRGAKPQAAGQTSASQATRSSQAIDFDRDIRPTLESSCVPCHGPERHEGQLRLDSEAAILRGGVSGKIVVPGNGPESLLVKRLLGAGGAPRMPLGAEPLSAENIALIRAWIDQGSFLSTPPNASQSWGSRAWVSCS